MKAISCAQCGSNRFVIKNGYRMCTYCNSRYAVSALEMPLKESSIVLNEDVQRLLNKCREDPVNARRYANLILDIDPGNAEALRIIR